MPTGDFESGRTVALLIPDAVWREWKMNGVDAEALTELQALSARRIGRTRPAEPHPRHRRQKCETRITLEIQSNVHFEPCVMHGYAVWFLRTQAARNGGPMALKPQPLATKQLLLMGLACIGGVLVAGMFEARSNFNELESKSEELEQTLKSIQEKKQGCATACQIRMPASKQGLDPVKVKALEEFIAACETLQKATDGHLVAQEQYINSTWSGTPWFAMLPWYSERYSKLQDGIRTRIASAKSESASYSCSKR